MGCDFYVSQPKEVAKHLQLRTDHLLLVECLKCECVSVTISETIKIVASNDQLLVRKLDLRSKESILEGMTMLPADLNFLVVEDNDFQRHWLQVMLSNVGARNIYHAADGHEALRILTEKKNTIDIGFIDLNLPGMDGMELIRHISHQEHSPSIVLASALSPSLIFSVRTMSEAYGINLLGTIEKPATPDTILNLIKLHQLRPKAGSDLIAPKIEPDQIRSGLANDEFEAFFQPQVGLATGQVSGLEALARWRHPEHGMLSPSSFLPSLQESAEIAQLDLLIFKKALATCGKLLREAELLVSVNISASSCADATFVENVLAFVNQQGLDPGKIAFEISEAAAIKNAPNLLESLVRLRMKGFGISIDEYGTAHSGVQELLRIPFSELKIARAMIQGPSNSPSLEIALALSFELCRKLNCRSAAVGVETKKEWDLLQKLGCDYAQGHYIAQPMDEETLFLWMNEWSQFF